MTERPHVPDLFARIASEQDAALTARASLHEDLGRALVDRMARRAARRPARRAGMLIGGGAVLALAVVLVVGSRLRPLRFEVESGAGSAAGSATVPGSAGTPLAAEAHSDLPLRFSDGSTVTFRPGSRGRVERLHGGGAEIVVQDGRLEAAVIHAERTRWVVQAGPFSVRVTGTRFAVDWQSADGRLGVDVREGSVVVEGGVLGAGVAVSAGQRLKVAIGDGEAPSVQSEALAPALAGPSPSPSDAPAAGGPEPGATPAPSPSPSGGSWQRLAAQGEHRQALRAAEKLGLRRLRRQLDASGLLTLGDVARFARAPREARMAFESLVKRFPDDSLASDAVFSLGRLAVESSRPREAAQWFARYVQKWPDGALAEQAGGRLLEAALARGEPALIERAALEYLRRNPQGPHADLARQSLGRSPR